MLGIFNHHQKPMTVLHGEIVHSSMQCLSMLVTTLIHNLSHSFDSFFVVTEVIRTQIYIHVHIYISDITHGKSGFNPF